MGWRTVLALVAALLLPLSIYALITIGTSYRDDRRAVEVATLSRSQKIADAVDARLLNTAAMMRVLATVRSIRARNWQEAYERAREIAALDPDWRSVALIDLDRGLRLFDLREPAARPAPLNASVDRALADRSRTGPTFSGIVKGPTGSPELEAYLAIGAGRKPQYLLRVTLDPIMVQRILMRLAPRDGTSAVVDPRGLFIARTKAWPQRLGTPATVYLRRASAAGRSGFYKSITWEGFVSYTAFTTLPDGNWTTHVAVSSSLIDSPQYGWRLSSILAALASLALAALLVFLIIRLIATRQASELRTAQAERLEAVGQLAGGVAHDFNNMLAIVLGNLELSKRRLSNGNTDVTSYIDNAMDGAHRAADLTRRLLAFSRRQPLTPAPVDANALIDAMRELLRHTLAGNIQIETGLAADLWPTFVDSGQLENALVNLAVNARDAMPDGGMITISTANRPARDGAPTDRIEITVTDTGSGMPPAVAARAFEPFFTTKELGRGTGLGLSQIHSFATQSGGTATIDSIVGQGTSVTILLPRHDPSMAEPVAAQTSE